MKRTLFVLALALAASLMCPSAVWALSRGQLQPIRSLARVDHGRFVTAPPALKSALGLGRTAPVARSLKSPSRIPGRLALGLPTGPCTVTGTVLNYDGSTAPKDVDVDAWSGDTFLGSATTAADGTFTFSALPATTDAEFDVFFTDGSGYQTWGNTLMAGPNDFTLRPGRTGAHIVRTTDPDWNWWQSARVETWGSHGGGTSYTDGASGDAFVMWPDYYYAVAYPFDDQGIEWSASSIMPVVVGADDGQTMSFDQADGRGSWFMAPRWESGRPGTKTRLVLENWPAAFQIAFYGYSQFTPNTVKDWPFYVQSDGSKYGTLNLTIPTTARPGYDYELHAYRYDDPSSGLDLTNYFQVASLKSTKSAIGSGGSIRLSGVIPTQGHWGTKAGKVKQVTIYRRYHTAGQPGKWDARAAGWTRLGTVRANGLGRYRSALLHPKRTTWYVVRYPGDGWYFRAFTSVIKVRVR